jgi:hypothetical protein
MEAELAIISRPSRPNWLFGHHLRLAPVEPGAVKDQAGLGKTRLDSVHVGLGGVGTPGQIGEWPGAQFQLPAGLERYQAAAGQRGVFGVEQAQQLFDRDAAVGFAGVEHDPLQLGADAADLFAIKTSTEDDLFCLGFGERLIHALLLPNTDI